MVEERFIAVLGANPDIDNLIIFRPEIDRGSGSIRFYRRILQHHYDMVIDLHGGPRSAIMTAISLAKYRLGYCRSLRGWIAYNYRIQDDGVDHHSIETGLRILEPFGVYEEAGKWLPRFHLKQECLKRIKGTLERLGMPGEGRKMVLIHPGAGWPFKRWKNERFARFADAMIDRYGTDVIMTEGHSENLIQNIADRMEHKPIILKNLEIQELGALISQTDLFVCHDSGPMHMASAMKVPVVALFGPSNVNHWRPRSPGAVVIQAKLPCCPCRQKSCSRPDDYCMDTITEEEVLEAASGLLLQDTGSDGASL